MSTPYLYDTVVQVDEYELSALKLLNGDGCAFTEGMCVTFGI